MGLMMGIAMNVPWEKKMPKLFGDIQWEIRLGQST